MINSDLENKSICQMYRAKGKPFPRKKREGHSISCLWEYSTLHSSISGYTVNAAQTDHMNILSFILSLSLYKCELLFSLSGSHMDFPLYV